MDTESCSYLEKYECPLCPLAANHNQIWYSEDDICKNEQFETVTKSMKKLNRKAAQGFFTLGMLDRGFIVRRGVEGIDPDLPDSMKDPWKEYQSREKMWLKKHPEISVSRSVKLKLRGKALGESRKSIQKVPPDNAVSDIIDSTGVITRLSPQTLQKPIENGGIEK